MKGQNSFVSIITTKQTKLSLRGQLHRAHDALPICESDSPRHQAFDLDYDIAQSLCSHIVPKAVILFTGEALNDGMDFEPEDGEGDDDKDKEGDDEGGGGMGLPFPASVKTTGE